MIAPEITVLAPNFTRLDIGTVTIWYSYQTTIAFMADGKKTVRVNSWSSTTGKHLNAVDFGTKDAKAARVSGEEFERLLALAPSS